MSDAATVARGLTKAQRTFLLQGNGKYHFAPSYKPGERLVELGLLCRKRIGFGHHVTITPLGLAVRAILQQEQSK